MYSSTFLSALERRYPPEGSARITAALHQDELVWRALDDEDFCRRVLEADRNALLFWSPSNLALIALGSEIDADALASLPMQVPASALRQQAVRMYEEATKRAVRPANLREAGLLAIALRERRRMTGSWTGLANEILYSSSGTVASSGRIWRTALACLFGIIPDPNELLADLLKARDIKPAADWVIHVLLSLPMDDLDRSARLVQILGDVPVSRQIEFLKILHLRTGDSLTRSTAGSLLSRHPLFTGFRMKLDLDLASPEALSARILTLQQLASFNHLAGSSAQAEACLRLARIAANYWLAGMDLQSMNIALDDGADFLDTETNGRVLEHVQHSKRMTSEYENLILRKPDMDCLRSQIENGAEEPVALMSKALFAQQDSETLLAKDLGRRAATAFRKALGEDERAFVGDFVYTWNPIRLIHGLVTLGLTEDAERCADLSLKVRPSDPVLVEEYAQILIAQGKFGDAKNVVRLAVALIPGSLSLRRKLAEAEEKAGDWQAAYQHRKDCLGFKDGSGIEDQLAFSRAAIQAERPAEVVPLCEEILNRDNDHAAAHGWLGMAKAKMGEREEAAAHLSKATLLVPDEAEWWLMLSNMYRESGDKRHAHETLRAAVMAAPDSGLIYSALANLLLEDGLSSDALPYLKRSAELLPEDEHVGLVLCKTLRALGHPTEARGVASRLRSKWALQPELAYEFAMIVEDSGDPDEAIPALEIAVRSGQVKPEWMLAYAKVLLSDHDHLEQEPVRDEIRYTQAEHMISKVLKVQPEGLEAHLMMADVLRKKGKYEDALELYQALAEEPHSIQEDHLWEIQRGLGITALELNMIEPGLAAIKDAASRQPGLPELQRDLSRAYSLALLPNDSRLAAETALELAPHDLRNLDWYAEAMAKLGQPEKAEDALRMAVGLAPENPDLRLRLAQIQYQNGKPEEARQTLSSVTSEPGTHVGALRQAAYTYMRMGDLPAAMGCFEKAASQNEVPPSDLMFDIARLYEQMGESVAAFEAVQKAATSDCKDAHVFLFLSGLLIRQNRVQAAQAALEKGLKLAEQEPEAKRIPLEAELYRQMADTQYRSGSLLAAMQTAENALERLPKDPGLRILTARLAMSLLRFDKTRQMAIVPEGSKEVSQDWGELALIRAEVSLELGDYDEAARAWEMCAEMKGFDAWQTSVEARLEHRSGDWNQAVILAKKAIKAIESPDNPPSQVIWVAKAAIDTGLWEQGLALLEAFEQDFSNEPLGSYELGKAFAIAAETDRDFGALGCEAHRPEINVQLMDLYPRFKSTFDHVCQVCPSPDAFRWSLRGELAFAPTSSSIKEFSRLATTAGDTAALVRALRATGNWPAAALAAQQHADAPEVQLQLCLGYLAEDPERGYGIAKELADQFGRQPLLQALRSMLAEKSGKSLEALEAIQEAVTLWPDETSWQAKAGELSTEAGNYWDAVRYWKIAAGQKPGNVNYSLELGRAYMAVGDYPSAVTAFDRTTCLAPENAVCWMELAFANKLNGNLNSAMEAAQHATDLDGAIVDSVLLSSEIAREMGEAELAGEYARLAIRREPRNPNAVLALSKALSQQGLQKESLEEIENRLAELPLSLPLMFERAQLVYRLNGAAAASTLLAKLAQSYPEEPSVWSLLAKIQAESDDMNGAERSAFRSLRLDPDQPEICLMLGRIQRKTGQLDQAVHLFSEAIRTQPDSVEAYLELGETYQSRREHSTALEVYRRAIKVVPKDPRAYCQAAMIYKDSKDYLSAETMLQYATKLNPDDVQVRRQLIAVMALNLIQKSQESNTAI